MLYCARLNWVEIPNEGKFVVLCTCIRVDFNQILAMLVHGDIAEAESVLTINYEMSLDICTELKAEL